MEWQDYMMKNTNVLKNKFNITSQEELDKKENEILIEKLSYLFIYGMPGNFDSDHLSNIHRFLFEDIYYFAGQYREVDIFKETGFESYQNISSKLNEIFLDMNSKNVLNTKFEIAKYLADYYYLLIQIHPFREGNGRTCREFIRQLTIKKFSNYYLDFTKINKKNFQIGVIEHDNYPSLLAYEIYNALILKENEKEKNI